MPRLAISAADAQKALWRRSRNAPPGPQAVRPLQDGRDAAATLARHRDGAVAACRRLAPKLAEAFEDSRDPPSPEIRLLARIARLPKIGHAIGSQLQDADLRCAFHRRAVEQALNRRRKLPLHSVS